MDSIVSHVIAGLIGLAIAVIFEKPVQALKTSVISWIKWLKIRMLGMPTPPEPHTFVYGNNKTSWYVVDGNGEDKYLPPNISCVIDDSPIELPDEVIKLRLEIEQREEQKRRNNERSMWNGPLYALRSCVPNRNVPHEEMTLNLTFGLTDYYTFQATVMSLDKNLLTPPAHLTLRQLYIDKVNVDLNKPIPFLANGFGVVVAIVTSDEKLMFCRRSPDVGARAGELDVGVVEGLHPEMDAPQGNPDLSHAAARGVHEELGIDFPNKDRIVFLGIGIDLEYYQWNMLGFIRLEQTALEVINGRSRGAQGKWEADRIEVIEAHPEASVPYIANQQVWAVGKATIYWTLVHLYTKRRVDEAIKGTLIVPNPR